jgi:CRISPR system Cascade subunit CasE
VLWRIDVQGDGRALLYCSSPAKPDFSHVVERAGWPASDVAFESRDLSGLLERLSEGQAYAFRLAGNPVHSGRTMPDGPIRRLGHVTASQQLEWLVSRAPQMGIDIPVNHLGVPQLVLIDRRRIRFGHQGHRVTLVTATYEGALKVTDPELLRRALVSGVGHARAYGCGLMTLAPLVPHS